MSQLSHNSMHGNNVPLQIHRNDPYRQMEPSEMKTSHINNTARRGRHVQKYRVKYDEGTIMEAEDAHLELIEDDDDSGGEESGNEMGERCVE